VKFRSLQIGTKLTAWYMLFMLIGFAAGGGLAFLNMRNSIHATVDGQLRERLSVVRETVNRRLRAGQVKELGEELDEDSELRPESDLLQISDQEGRWIYQSRTIKPFQLSMRPARTATSEARTEVVKDTPIRLITETVSLNGEVYYIQIAARMDGFYGALNRFRGGLLVFLPLILVVATAGGYWTSRRALSPVDAISLAAQQINPRNLSSRITVPDTGDELQRLSETLNAMLGRVDAAMQKVTQFTTDASHELRTPITIMRTRAELALRRLRSEGEYRETIEQLHGELVRTSQLVDNLMLLARADAGAELIQLEEVDLVDLLRRVVSRAAPLAEERGVCLRANLPERTAVWIEGDSQLLGRLFLQLIDNAVKYTPAPGYVSIEVADMDKATRVTVVDSGIGIAETDLPHIFDRFYRADKTRSRESGGAGIGLSIGRWIAEAHLGSLNVESRSGVGSRFFVILPKKLVRASPGAMTLKA
jgi:heavy metal sensor kinase